MSTELRLLLVSWMLAACSASSRFDTRETTPSQDATGVAVTSEVNLAMRRSVDIANAQVFWSVYGETRRIPAVLEAVGRRELRVTPLETPPWDRVQEVRVVGLASGSDRGEVVLRFRTRPNPEISTFEVSSWRPNRACTLNAGSRVARCGELREDLQPGDDSIFDADEFDFEASDIDDYTYEGERLVKVVSGRLQEGSFERAQRTELFYGDRETLVLQTLSAPGPDERLNTPDDTFEWGLERSLDPDGFAVETYMAFVGDDQRLGTEDDRLGTLSRHEAHSSGFERAVVDYRPGPDRVFRTADDAAEAYVLHDYDELGRVTTTSHVVTTNGVPFDADDIVETVEHWVYGDDGRAIGMWIEPIVGTGEPEARRYTREGGLVVLIERLDDAGPDGEWFTADDGGASEFSAITYDADGQRIRAEEGHVGEDGVSGTEDDTLRTVRGFAP